MSSSIRRRPRVGKLGPEEAIYHIHTLPLFRGEGKWMGVNKPGRRNTRKLSYIVQRETRKFFFNGRALSGVRSVLRPGNEPPPRLLWLRLLGEKNEKKKEKEEEEEEESTKIALYLSFNIISGSYGNLSIDTL